MSWTTECTSVIFSYEKKFSLDDPHDFQYCCHCLKQKEQYCSTHQKKKRKFDGMVFPFDFRGRLSLVFTKDRQYHNDYIQQLETEFLPNGSDYEGKTWIDQQDGSSIHIA